MGMKETVIVSWFENCDRLGGDRKTMVLDGLLDCNGLSGTVHVEVRLCRKHGSENRKELDCL